MPKAPVIPVTRDEAVDINTYIFDMLQASRDPSVSPFLGLSRPASFPLQQLNRSLAQVSKTATAMSVIKTYRRKRRTASGYCSSLCLTGHHHFLLMKLSLLPGR